MLAMTIIQCVTESAAFFVDGNNFAGLREVSLVLNSLLYINNILFSFAWTVYADFKLFGDNQRIKKYYGFVGIPALLVTIGSIVNLFTPVFYRISEGNVYSRTELFIIPYIFTYLYLAYGVGIIYKYRKKVRKYLFLPAIIFMIPILLGSLLQFFFYGFSLVWIGVAIAIVSLYINVQNEVSYVDPLSGLFTRQYMNHYLDQEIKKQPNSGKMLAGIMMDIDNFKSINDNFGHLVGDDAILAAGQIMHKAASEGDFAVRFAGDEFVIICLADSYAYIDRIISSITDITEEYNETEKKPYKLSFSMGYSVYGGSDDSADAFLGRMDAAMYEHKRSKIEKRQLPDRRGC